MGFEGSQEWISNVSVQVEEPREPPEVQPKLRGRRRIVPPNVWIYFPTYHGERERFNGECATPVPRPKLLPFSLHLSALCPPSRKEPKPICSHPRLSASLPRPYSSPPSTLCGPSRPERAPPHLRESSPRAGFCEDKLCECTSPPVLASCHRHPECRGKHMCRPLPRGSAKFVEHARRFSAALRSKGKLLGYELSSVQLSPFYDDCWERRGRCQGFRPCKEPVDAAWTCRATAMLCNGRTWEQALAKAKAWIPAGHQSASLLYLFDGQVGGAEKGEL